ncbi:SusC/RagA family TonB-linked outer membrane protein [Arcticibacter tournemirensis]|uniref:SusC/RagA family TonB-linked outer membrane protein n=1 Tax=Arcticibacter tournemirensis TaxID=699437 RepID=A0A4Q0M697_9SPHI|nr:SusC/RagA family TonB-linked outer membrane protein [Arcticibacter tournemirensis]RXF68279.1 SusC/RagA family TonB-linked outer membrane protein [Arcticibacter tournemirensis]
MKQNYFRMFLLFLMIAFNQAYAQRSIPVSEALKKITRIYKAEFAYDPVLLKDKMTSYNLDKLQGKSLEDVLKGVLYPNELVFLYVKPHLYTIVEKSRIKEASPKTTSTEAEAGAGATIKENQLKVSGTVRDEKGIPVAAVTVTEKGTRNATATRENGTFSLTVSDANAVLIFRSVGFNQQEEELVGRSSVDVFLSSGNNQLTEVVVTALGIKREEKALGYAVQTVKGNKLQTVKGVDMATSLTGQVAGLVVKNSTEFNATPVLQMRGEDPMLVIDGIPYQNMTLRDIPADDIESINMLKGPTAAALYGSRGAKGAIMITTKKGKSDKISIDVNSNTMMTLGYIAIPKTQTSYGHGLNGKIGNDYVWGPKLDIGKEEKQWNPVTKQEEMMPLVSSGKNNLRNFMQTGFITNNNISLTQGGEKGFFRVGLNQIHNKGQFPNQKLNIYNYTMSGEIKMGEKLTLEGHMGYSRNQAPQVWGGGYGTQGYIYQIMMWTGPDYDIRQYRDYWVTPNVKQNWMYNAWYDNPYLIAYEKLKGVEQNKLNASLIMNYAVTKDLKIMFRNGYDYYKNEESIRNPAGIFSTNGGTLGTNFNFAFNGKGMFGFDQLWGNSINSDLIVNYNKSFAGKWNIDALAGGSIFYFKNREFGARTRNGLSVPGWYSLANAVASTTAGVDAIVNNYGTWAQQINSAYGKMTLSWNNAVYLDVTGRNDWSSTQASNVRSYFYPSVAGSVVVSELMGDLPDWLSMWKVRGSWTVTKKPSEIYDNNLSYNTSNLWGNTSATTPDNLADPKLPPTTFRTWEFGTAGYFFNNRLHIDAAYFTKLAYNIQTLQPIAASSGYATILINTDETRARRGVEITLDGTPIKNKRFQWQSIINYATQHEYVVKLDPIYSPNNLWYTAGARRDVFAQTEHALRDPQGNMIHQNGLPMLSKFVEPFGYKDPKFSFGFINNFTFGNVSLGVNIDGRVGGIMYNYIYNKMYDTGSAPETDNQFRYDEVVNGLKNYVGNGVKVVSGEVTYDSFGRITSDTRQYAPNDVPVSYQSYTRLWGNSYEHGVMSKGFVKIREISLGYAIPKNWLGKSGVRNAAITITGQNLFLFTKFKYSDPDVDNENMNAPAQRMVGLNIRLGI